MYALISDLHFHNWTAFAHQNGNINSRLLEQLDALRCVVAYCQLKEIKTIVIAGDVFHVRGSLVPSVLNPVLDLFRDIEDANINVYAIPGNHDLESKASEWELSALTPLELAGVTAFHEPHFHRGDDGIVLIPWQPSLPELLKTMEAMRHECADHTKVDCIIHAPLNGVVKGIPDIGLMPSELEQFGYRNVFCGHYHNHKQMSLSVWSIGALTHQTWSDVGSLAGFMVVHNDGSVEHHQIPDAPKFVDLDLREDEQPADPKRYLRGNYVRVTLDGSDEEMVRTAKEGVSQLGARGALVRVVPPATTRITRDDEVKNAGSMEQAVGLYVQKTYDDQNLQDYCNDLMQRACR